MPLSLLLILLASFTVRAEISRFRLISEHASRIEVCLFTAPRNQSELGCFPLTRITNENRWELELSKRELARLGIAEDAPIYYGFRLWGPNWEFDRRWVPGTEFGFRSDVDDRGNRFNPNKLVLDPYAREITHGLEAVADPNVVFSGPETRGLDSAPFAPKSVLRISAGRPFRFPKPEHPFRDDVIYEVHLKGFTKNDPEIPENLRGTYKGAALKAKYLKDLGVTAVEFLPIHQSYNTDGNYWGYMTLGYFAPQRSYAFDQSPGGPTREFREMVDEFHRHGIKVYIDVVYNHTGEGGIAPGEPERAPIVGLRGIDNSTYYDLAADPRYYADHTGCGNDLAAFRPVVRDLVMDSLRYWTDQMGVDGFRFDLASVLGNARGGGAFQFDARDPAGILQRAVKELPARPADGGAGIDLIAEPWAIGDGTYQSGAFPPGWAEWNGGFRDRVRAFMNKRGIEPVPVGDLAHAVAGSSRFFQFNGRKPWHSVNFITAHDGFTLLDLFSYNEKRNSQAAPFGPSDGGEDHNRSWDQGGDPRMQKRAARTAMMLLLLSAGTPMINGGDEFSRTLKGNNNAYNLDTEGNWLNWREADREMIEFTRRLLRFRREYPALRPAEFFTGRDGGQGIKDIAWHGPRGQELAGLDFDAVDGFLAYRMNLMKDGSAEDARSAFVILNSGTDSVDIVLPAPAAGYVWRRVLDSATDTSAQERTLDCETVVTGVYRAERQTGALLVERPSK